VDLATEWALVEGLVPEDLSAAVDLLGRVMSAHQVVYEGLFGVGGLILVDPLATSDLR
jgi:hypothetical protein